MPGRGASIPMSKNRRLPGKSVHGLDNDSLLNVFRLCRPNIFDENQDLEDRVIHGGEWVRECWWYRPAQVCQRWRRLILGSASYLRLSLVCTHGTPVAAMLAHSPPFPIIIVMDDANKDFSAEDEEGIMFALQHRDRVRSIHIGVPTRSLERLVTALDEEFPVLQYIHIAPSTKHSTCLALPPKFEAPQLRHLVLSQFASPIGLPLLTTAIDLVTLLLRWMHTSTYPHPDLLLETLSHLPQLETFQISFRSPVTKAEIGRKLWRKPVSIHATLPNLRWFSFAGVSTYLEALLPHMAMPAVETLKVIFFNQLSYPIPQLLQFITITENLTFSIARFCLYSGGVAVWVYPRSGTKAFTFYMHVSCEHFDWQVSSLAQIFDVLGPAFSTVVDVTLDYAEHSSSSEWHNQADRTLWRKFLGSLRHVQTLRVHKGLVGELSRSLRSDEGSPLELLPELKELVCPRDQREDDAFAPFIQERRVAGRPINHIVSPFPVGRIDYVVQSPTGMSRIN